MSIQQGGAIVSSRPGAASVLGPIGPARTRTTEVVDRLMDAIQSGRLPLGARLPTEQELTAAMGVSRTVVREAVAALRAEGLVVSRQGLGMFVARDVQRRPFRIDPDGLRSIGEVLNVMELRLAVEVEAAGLAAERAGPKQVRAIAEALAAIDRAIGRNEAAIDEDFAFHRAIAQATGNPQFTRFLEYLGRFIIPRLSVRIEARRLSEPRHYLQTIQREHRAICEAVQRRDAAAARAAMRNHLLKGRARYRRLIPAGR